jgi:hypothetical protein
MEGWRDKSKDDAVLLFVAWNADITLILQERILSCAIDRRFQNPGTSGTLKRSIDGLQIVKSRRSAIQKGSEMWKPDSQSSPLQRVKSL